MRGVAIVGMISFHLDIVNEILFNKDLCTSSIVWELIRMFNRIMFFVLVGLSLHLGSSKGKYATLSASLRRSGFLFAIGMLITLGTYFFGLGAGIYFGVLHCIGVSSLIAFLLSPLPKYAILGLSALIITSGAYCQANYTYCWHPSLFWLYPCYCARIGNMFDYFPLVPWLGFVLSGLLLGKQFYPQGQRSFSLSSSLGRAWLVCVLRYLGRRSLFIYLVHLPIVYVVLYLVNYCTS